MQTVTNLTTKTPQTNNTHNKQMSNIHNRDNTKNPPHSPSPTNINILTQFRHHIDLHSLVRTKPTNKCNTIVFHFGGSNLGLRQIAKNPPKNSKHSISNEFNKNTNIWPKLQFFRKEADDMLPCLCCPVCAALRAEGRSTQCSL